MVNIHGNLHKIRSRKRFSGAAANSGSSRLNYLRNEM